MLFLILMSDGTRIDYESFISPIVMYTYTIHTYNYLTVHAYNSFTHTNICSCMETTNIRPLTLTVSSQVPPRCLFASCSGTCWRACLANQEGMRGHASQSRECVSCWLTLHVHACLGLSLIRGVAYSLYRPLFYWVIVRHAL